MSSNIFNGINFHAYGGNPSIHINNYYGSSNCFTQGFYPPSHTTNPPSHANPSNVFPGPFYGSSSVFNIPPPPPPRHSADGQQSNYGSNCLFNLPPSRTPLIDRRIGIVPNGPSKLIMKGFPPDMDEEQLMSTIKSKLGIETAKILKRDSNHAYFQPAGGVADAAILVLQEHLPGWRFKLAERRNFGTCYF
jgi:hypothetical protein